MSPPTHHTLPYPTRGAHHMADKAKFLAFSVDTDTKSSGWWATGTDPLRENGEDSKLYRNSGKEHRCFNQKCIQKTIYISY